MQRPSITAAARSSGPWIGLLAAATAGIALMCGLPESPFLPLLPAGAEPPAWLGSLARAVGLDESAPSTASLRASILMGSAALAFGMLALLAWWGRVSTRTAVTASLVLIAVVAILPPMLSRDVYSYAMYGRIWVEGSNPYIHPPIEFLQDPFIGVVSSEWVRSPSVYGPVFTILSGGIVKAFGSSPAATIAAFKILSAVALGLTVVIAAALGERTGRGRGAFAAVLVGLNPVLLFHTVGGGHNDVLVGLALVGALALWRERPLAATAVLTLGTLVKLVAAIPLGLAIAVVFLRAGPGLGRKLRAAAPHAGLAVGLTAVLLIPFGYSKSVVSAFATLLTRLGWASPVRLVAYKSRDLGVNVSGPDLGEALYSIAQTGFTLLAVIVLLLILRRLADGDPRVTTADAWGWGLLVASLCAAYLLPWYVAWFLPALALSSRGAPVAVGVAMSVLLAMTGIPAEPGFDNHTWRSMLFMVHYVIAPIMLGLLAAALLDLRRVLLGPPSRSPRP